MHMDIDYNTAMRDFPTEAKQVIAQLRKSRSKKKNAAPATLNWRYIWGVEIRSQHSLVDIISGKATEDQEIREAMTLQEKLDDHISRVFCSIQVNKFYSTKLATVPAVVQDLIRKNLIMEEAEDRRIDQLTDEEREAEVAKLLAELGADPGFAAVVISKEN